MAALSPARRAGTRPSAPAVDHQPLAHIPATAPGAAVPPQRHGDSVVWSHARDLARSAEKALAAGVGDWHLQPLQDMSPSLQQRLLVGPLGPETLHVRHGLEEARILALYGLLSRHSTGFQEAVLQVRDNWGWLMTGWLDSLMPKKVAALQGGMCTWQCRVSGVPWRHASW